MKKAVRILLPVILAFAVIACAAWYLFVYDRDFTRDLLLQQARHFERSGNHTIAEWFYDKAYAHANQDEDVAIELANQYKTAGNYTKAEYTLSNAIADGGTAKLYIALCKTYVEQNKLLDAVTMLDNIADTAIRDELDARRPAAPTADPAPGFYSEYLDVTITAESGTLYVASGEYPSVVRDAYTAPYSLPAGETTLYAVSVSEDGLVSPLAIFGYTVGGVIEQVSFSDPAIEREVRSALGVSERKVLYSNDLWAITSFTVPSDAKTYTDLAHLPYLTELTLHNAPENVLSVLSELTVLKSLDLTGSHPTEEEMTLIGALPVLENLTLAGCGLSSIDGLSPLQNLQSLDLSGNAIRNLDALTNMRQLAKLNLANNAVNDLSAISGLAKLTELDVSYNDLSSIAPICTAKNLTHLDVSHNNLISLGAIDNLTELTYFSAAYNRLGDVLQLRTSVKLTELDISNNNIQEISVLGLLDNLTTLNFSYNSVSELPQFSENASLIIIDGSYNELSSLEPLAGIDSLNQVLMDYNSEIRSVDCLAGCGSLYLVNVFGTRVTEASALTSLSITVNFDPTSSMAGADGLSGQ